MNKKILGSISLVYVLVSISFATAVNMEKTNSIIKPSDLLSTKVPYNNITFTLKTDKKEYKIREAANISFQLTNTGNEDITITTPNSDVVDFVVLDGFWNKRYQDSMNHMHLNAVWHTKIPAGKTIYFNFTWNQKGNFFSFFMFFAQIRHQLKPGLYYIVGFMPGNYQYITCTKIIIKKNF